MDLVEAFGLLRVEELRADLYRELKEAAGWTVTATPTLGMCVQVGPHQVCIAPSWPAAGRMDAVCVVFDGGRVRAVALTGTPSRNGPALPVVPDRTHLVLAYVNVHAGACMLFQHNIVVAARAEWRQQ